jgi:hypothetical protein
MTMRQLRPGMFRGTVSQTFKMALLYWDDSRQHRWTGAPPTSISWCSLTRMLNESQSRRSWNGCKM